MPIKAASLWKINMHSMRYLCLIRKLADLTLIFNKNNEFITSMWSIQIQHMRHNQTASDIIFEGFQVATSIEEQYMMGIPPKVSLLERSLLGAFSDWGHLRFSWSQLTFGLDEINWVHLLSMVYYVPSMTSNHFW